MNVAALVLMKILPWTALFALYVAIVANADLFYTATWTA